MSDWKRWAEERPPNSPGAYRWRSTKVILGLELTPEWTEEMTLCGMGYKDPEYWPLSPCNWDGWNRYMLADVEWRDLRDDDPKGIVWGGLDLLPCPFTGKQPVVEFHGRYIGAPPFLPEYLILKSPMFERRYADANLLLQRWNTRVQPSEALA